MARWIALSAALLALVATSAATASFGEPSIAWHLTPTGSAARLRGLSAVSANVAWASGSLGTVLRTTNRGATWQQVGPPGTEALQFRDIEAFDARKAVILSIGVGGDSRIYVTSDAGASWTLAFQNPDPNAFYDCMAFYDRRHGLALSDPVGGKFRILATQDGGHTWAVVQTDMPPALPSEFAFAASGQCLVTEGHRAWFGTGGDVQSRVFRSDDGGVSWEVSSTPVRSGPSAGIFALAFRNTRQGLAVGGDFAAPDNSPEALAQTWNGGSLWQLVSDPPNEYRSGAAWLDDRVALAVGPTGSDVSDDQGDSWRRFDSGSFDTVDCTHGSCWAAGEQGRVAYLVSSPR